MSSPSNVVSLTSLLSEIAKYDSNNFQVPILPKSESGRPVFSYIKQIIDGLFANPKIGYFYFDTENELWKLEKKEFIEVVELIRSYLKKAGIEDDMKHGGSTLWTPGKFSIQLYNDAQQWSREERLDFCEKCFLINTLLPGHIVSFPFRLAISDYLGLLEKCLVLNSSATWVYNCLLLEDERHLADQFKEKYLFLLGNHEFALKLKELAKEDAKELNLLRVNLTESKVKQLFEILSNKKTINSLSVKLDFSDKNSNVSMVSPLFNALIAKGCVLYIVLEPNADINIEKLKQFIIFLGKKNNVFSLLFRENELSKIDLKGLKEIVYCFKNFTKIENIQLWSSDNVTVETAKEWSGARRSEYLECLLLKEGLWGSDVSEFPFPLKLDEYQSFFESFLKQFPRRSYKMMKWIDSTKEHLSEDDFLFLKSHFAFCSKNSQYDLDVTGFAKNKNLLSQLLKNMKMCPTAPHPLVALTLTFTNFESQYFDNLMQFINQVLMPFDKRLIIHLDVDVQKIILFLSKLNNAYFDSIALSGEDLPDLSLEKAMNLAKSFTAQTGIKSLKLFGFNLNALSDSDLLKWVGLLVENKNLTSLNLAGNGLQTRSIPLLYAVHDTIKKSSVQNFDLYHCDTDFDELKKKWDKERCMEFAKFHLAFLVQRKGLHFDQKPFCGLLEPSDTFDLLCQFLKADIVDPSFVFFHVGRWVGNMDFTYAQRHTLLKLCLTFPTDTCNVIPFKLEPQHRLQAYLVFCKNQGHELLMNFHAVFDLFDTKLTASCFLDPWKPIVLDEELDNNPNNFNVEMIDNMDFDNLAAKVREKLIPDLKAASEKLLGEKHFCTLAFNKIIAVKIKEGDNHALFKWLLQLQWYTWFLVGFVSTGMQPKDFIGLARVLKEIVDFRDPGMRYKAGQLLLDTVINNPKALELYSELTDKRPNHTLIPALFLCKIMLEQPMLRDETSKKHETVLETKGEAESKSLTERKQSNEVQLTAKRYKALLKMAKAILYQVGGNYAFGVPASAFAGALHALTEVQNLTHVKKLSILERLFDQRETRLKEYFYNIKTKFTVITGIELQQEMLRILGKDTWSKIENRLSQVHQAIFAQSEDIAAEQNLNALSRSILALFLNINNPLLLRNEMSNWYLLQGLSLLRELQALVDTEATDGQNVIFRAIAKIFNLEDSQMKFYSEVFSGKRCETALFTYLGKIRQLAGAERTSLEKRLFGSIGLMLSKNSQLFYEGRYSASKVHLAKVFQLNPKMKTFWPVNQRFGFNDFVKKHKLDTKFYEINLATFIYNKIFRFSHYPASHCLSLKSYFDNSKSKKIQEEIKNALKQNIEMNLKQAKELGVDRIPLMVLQDLLQLELITIMELPKVDKAAIVKSISKAMSYLKRIDTPSELLADLKGLHRGFGASNDKLDLQKTKGWTIVFTDDFSILFKSGSDMGSCQREDGNINLSKCLLAFVQDGKHKLIAVLDENEVAMARCYVTATIDKVSEKALLFLEDRYPFHIKSEERAALEHLASCIADDCDVELLSREATENSRTYPHPVDSIGGVGPEYVDALFSIAPEGIFTLNNAQVLHSPFEPYFKVLEEQFQSSTTEEMSEKALDRVVRTILDYVDPFATKKSLHFQWKQTVEEEELPSGEAGVQHKTKLESKQ